VLWGAGGRGEGERGRGGGTLPFIANDLAEAVEHASVEFLSGSTSALLKLAVLEEKLSVRLFDSAFS
jgi:hypothetical protein